MKKSLMFLSLCAALALTSGCAYLGGKTNLKQVADANGMMNVTTGDGTFENYQAVGHYSGTEIGIGVGIPWLIKLMELYPARTNEDLLGDVAGDAKADGSNAMINVTPAKSLYTGIPFFFVGVYVDGASGTGIAQK
jgi:hypothetical protein